MNLKSSLGLVLSFFCLAALFSSCQSSKVAFGNSYYFKQTPKTVAQSEPQVKPSSEVDPLPASDRLAVSSIALPSNTHDVTALMDQARAQVAEAAQKSDNEQLKQRAARVSDITAFMKEGNMSKREMKAQRKELRHELKELKKEYKSLAPNEKEEMDKLIMLTIILAAGGLLFLILGALVPGLGIIGLLALIGSLVTLIIWATRQ